MQINAIITNLLFLKIFIKKKEERKSLRVFLKKNLE